MIKKSRRLIFLLFLLALSLVILVMFEEYKKEQLSMRSIFTNDKPVQFTLDEESRLSMEEYSAQLALEDSKKQALWLKRARVEMRDAIINGRFVIAPLGISLDPATLPEGTAYSYYWNTSEKAYVQIEIGKYDTGDDDNCFGLIEVLKDLNDTDEDSRYPLKWMKELASNKNLTKELYEKDFAFYVKPQSPCDAMGLHYDEKEGYIFDSNGEKISELGKQIEKAIQTAEYVK